MSAGGVMSDMHVKGMITGTAAKAWPIFVRYTQGDHSRKRLTCRDSSNDEPEDAGHSLKDPAPVRDGCVGGLAASVLSGVIPDLDGCCTIEG